MGNQNRSGTYDTPTGRALSVADMKHVEAVNTSVTMASDDTQYSYAIARGGKGFSFFLADDTVAWRWSMTAGEVAGSGGTAALAGEKVTIEGPNVGQTFYAAHTAGASQTLVVIGEVPE